jgi:hypothetical protein
MRTAFDAAASKGRRRDAVSRMTGAMNIQTINAEKQEGKLLPLKI